MSSVFRQVPPYWMVIRASGFDPSRVAVELNGRICPRARVPTVEVADGDSMEIVSFVGG